MRTMAAVRFVSGVQRFRGVRAGCHAGGPCWGRGAAPAGRGLSREPAFRLALSKVRSGLGRQHGGAAAGQEWPGPRGDRALPSGPRAGTRTWWGRAPPRQWGGSRGSPFLLEERGCKLSPGSWNRSLCSVSLLQNRVAARRPSVTPRGCQRAPWGPRPQRPPARPPAVAPARGRTGRQGPRPPHGPRSQTGRPARWGPDASCPLPSNTVTNGSPESRRSAQRPPLRLESGGGARRGPGPVRVLP